MKVIIIGPPGSGKSTISPIIAKELNVPQVRTNAIMRIEYQNKTKEGIEWMKWREEHNKDKDKGKIVSGEHFRTPPSIFIPAFVKHFGNGGWVLERGPKQPSFFEEYKNGGIFPDRVIVLDLPEEICLDRIQTRVIDPVSGFVYNLKANPPTDPQILSRITKRKDDTIEYVKARLKAYREEGLKVADLYPPNIVKHVNANQPLEAVIKDIVALLKEKNT